MTMNKIKPIRIGVMNKRMIRLSLPNWSKQRCWSTPIKLCLLNMLQKLAHTQLLKKNQNKVNRQMLFRMNTYKNCWRNGARNLKRCLLMLNTWEKTKLSCYPIISLMPRSRWLSASNQEITLWLMMTKIIEWMLINVILVNRQLI